LSFNANVSSTSFCIACENLGSHLLTSTISLLSNCSRPNIKSFPILTPYNYSIYFCVAKSHPTIRYSSKFIVRLVPGTKFLEVIWLAGSFGVLNNSPRFSLSYYLSIFSFLDVWSIPEFVILTFTNSKLLSHILYLKLYLLPDLSSSLKFKVLRPCSIYSLRLLFLFPPPSDFSNYNLNS